MTRAAAEESPIGSALPKPRVTLAFLALTAVAAYLAFIRLPGTEDMTVFWIRWSELVAKHGLREGYRQAFTDYPPGVFLIFKIANATLAPLSQFVLVKGMIVSAVAAGTVVYAAWTRSLGWTVGLLFALLLSSAILAYIDVLYLAPLFASLWALQIRRLIFASFFFSMAIMLKWQPIIIAPFFIAHAIGFSLEGARSYRAWLPLLFRLGAGAAAPIALCLLLVEPAMLWRAFTLATSHPALSLQGLNANWLIELYLYAEQGGKHVYDVKASAALSGTMRALFYFSYVLVFAIFAIRRRSFGEFVWFGCVAFLAYFLLNIGVHENHLFVPMVLGFALVGARHPHRATVICFLAVIANLNLLIFYGLEGTMLLKGSNMLFASGICAAINTLFGAFCLYGLGRSALPDLRHALGQLRNRTSPHAAPPLPL
ncbi:MAG: hypothetical protein ABIZ81_06455 [Opitutaceae bacterium]